MKNALHQKVLDDMLQYRKSRPGFRFWLRQVNKKDRLNQGIWFQGTEGYAFVGLYNRGGGTNMTRSFGLVFWQAPNGDSGVNLEIVWNEEKNQKIIEFYERTMEMLGNFKRNTKTKYSKFISSGADIKKAFEWLDKEKPRVDQLIKEMGLATELFISEEKFQKLLQKTTFTQKKESSMLSPAQIKAIQELYQDFTKTPAYEYRLKQATFIPYARKVLEAFVKSEEILNVQLTGLIQLFKAESGMHIAGRYLPKLFPDGEMSEILFEEFKGLEYKGYTGAGKNGITKLNEEQLEQVKAFLSNAFEVKTIEDTVQLTADFDSLDIPEVKKGVYSPWLFYINPELFPIINTRHVQFLEWLEVKPVYPEAIKLFAELRTVLKTSNLGILDAWVYEMEFDEHDDEDPDNDAQPLNTIFYGPPGTGKTYTTIARAIAIANPAFDLEQDRQTVKNEYKRLCDAGQIDFITFHQSLSYEDFIEGIKPRLVADDREAEEQSGELGFELKDGIFKRICQRAAYIPDEQTTEFHLSERDFDKADFFKVSLGDTQKSEDDDIYDYCVANNCIALGWGDWIDFTGKSLADAAELAKKEHVEGYAFTALKYLLYRLQPGSLVVISNGNYFCRGVARVSGEYFFDDQAPIDYTQFRKVEWLLTDVNIPVGEIYEKLFSQQSIYQLKKQHLRKEFFVKDDVAIAAQPFVKKNHILIIDEINRGNVSQIFGELITLLEEDKRSDGPEGLSITLPYSKKRFSVPSNLYIIGTMNTADRSVEALDTALRRRFCFEEMLPDHENSYIGTVGDIDLGKKLNVINKRLEKLLSRDHTIGHSYFIDIHDEEKLYYTFKNKIIPLLQEYFFGDYGKIGLVLGKGFVKEIEITEDKGDFFADFDYEDSDILLEKRVYRIHSFEQDSDYENFLNAVRLI